MSTTVPDSVIVAEYRANLADNYATCLTTTLACYEFFLLLEHEIFLLRRKWTGITWLFLANRYLLIAFVITMIAPYTPKNFLTVLTLMPGVVTAILGASCYGTYTVSDNAAF
ncbi:hypothetical protein EIP86_002158 [Pleurotus ostreatoroseus]|nr:hypothetical protein EIP86_002158 [Pleurotus ostreatoroseus]